MAQSSEVVFGETFTKHSLQVLFTSSLCCLCCSVQDKEYILALLTLPSSGRLSEICERFLEDLTCGAKANLRFFVIPSKLQWEESMVQLPLVTFHMDPLKLIPEMFIFSCHKILSTENQRFGPLGYTTGPTCYAESIFSVLQPGAARLWNKGYTKTHAACLLPSFIILTAFKESKHLQSLLINKDSQNPTSSIHQLLNPSPAGHQSRLCEPSELWHRWSTTSRSELFLERPVSCGLWRVSPPSHVTGLSSKYVKTCEILPLVT